jgi:hypothetical protein
VAKRLGNGKLISLSFPIFPGRIAENHTEFTGHFVMMAAVPVNFSAAGALFEVVEIFLGKRQEAVDNGTFLDLGQHAVAGDAAGKWLELILQSIEIDDFLELLLWILASDQAAENKFAVFEQISIARQQNPSFPDCSQDGGGIGSIGSIGGIGSIRADSLCVEADHAQQSCQPADIDIHQKYAG